MILGSTFSKIFIFSRISTNAMEIIGTYMIKCIFFYEEPIYFC
jgi:hypothetical protein